MNEENKDKNIEDINKATDNNTDETTNDTTPLKQENAENDLNLKGEEKEKYEKIQRELEPDKQCYIDLDRKLSQFKDFASKFIKESDYFQAIQKYNEMIEIIEKVLETNVTISMTERDAIKKDYYVTSYSNLAYIYIQLKNWDLVVKNSNRVLQLDKGNIKALYRKCTGNIYIGNYDLAEKEIEVLKENLGETEEVLSLIQLLKNKRNKEENNKRKRYKNIMTKLNKSNDEDEYKNMSFISKICYNISHCFKRVFCCCKNKRKKIKNN